MTDRPEEKRRLENLELNKETLQELTESESEAAQGGLSGNQAPAETASTGSAYVCCRVEG